MRLQLEHEWNLGEQLGEGGFGKVYAATAPDGSIAAVKLVPKVPGARRELLFTELTGVRNVVPILEHGETEDNWALVMPRAEKSLRKHLKDADAPLELTEAVAIMSDIAAALVDLDGKVVHRDLKPENVLYLDGHWCLADFGIARYAEATTAPDTQKYSMSYRYAAPERWRDQRATIAVDVYAVGVIAHELLTGRLPYVANELAELREQHLHADPPDLPQVPAALSALIDECLNKAAGARPTPAGLAKRLESASKATPSDGLAKLQEANRAEAGRRGQAARQESVGLSEAERRAELARAAIRSLARITETLREAIVEAASTASNPAGSRTGWRLQLDQATLQYVPATATRPEPWGEWQAPKFDVIAHAQLGIKFPMNRHGYEGRSHSLWYCDAQTEGQYQWFETAFMIGVFMRRTSSLAPFALDPGTEAAKGIYSMMGSEFQVAWPFTPISIGELDEFISRWAGWFADAASGRLNHPNSMPERSPHGSWRTT